MSIGDWQIIQRKLNIEADGIPGPATARGVMKALGLAPDRIDDRIVTGAATGIRRIFIHCTATREGQDIDAATIKRWHVTPKARGGRGWSDIGYHFVIRLDGTIERGRPEHVSGAHVAGFNTGSIGVVYVGGLDNQGRSKDTRTTAQIGAMGKLVRQLIEAYPGAAVMGHRDASPDRDGDGVIERHEWLKDCPCFDVASWLAAEGIAP